MFFRKRQPSAADETEFEEDFLVQSIDADNNVFIQSLDEITPEEIAPDAPERKGDVLFGMVRTLLIFVCMGVFVFCVWKAVDIQLQSRATDDFYSSLAEQIFADEASLPGSGISRMSQPLGALTLPIFADALKTDHTQSDLSGVAANKTYNMEFERMKAMLTDLAAQNPDIYGYIRIDGTNIAYPIVQYTDNEHYLHYQSNGMPSVSGSIYADVRCDRTLMNNVNVIFYGHNMTNGTMFNGVTKFFERDLFYNSKIVIYTFDGIYTYEPFAIFRTNSRFQYYTHYFADKQEIIDFCNLMQSQSAFNRGLTFTGDEKIITLSTCTNVGDGRYALHARLVKVEN